MLKSYIYQFTGQPITTSLYELAAWRLLFDDVTNLGVNHLPTVVHLRRHDQNND